MPNYLFLVAIWYLTMPNYLLFYYFLEKDPNGQKSYGSNGRIFNASIFTDSVMFTDSIADFNMPIPGQCDAELCRLHTDHVATPLST